MMSPYLSDNSIFPSMARTLEALYSPKHQKIIKRCWVAFNTPPPFGLIYAKIQVAKLHEPQSCFVFRTFGNIQCPVLTYFNEATRWVKAAITENSRNPIPISAWQSHCSKTFKKKKENHAHVMLPLSITWKTWDHGLLDHWRAGLKI